VFNLHSEFEYPSALRWWLTLVLICCAVTSIHAQETAESKSDGDDMFAGTQPAAGDKPTIKPILTDSPRATLTSFLRLRDELEQTLRSYRLDKSRELAEKVHVSNSQFCELLDLSAVPQSFRFQTGTDTTAFLLDIFGRVKYPAGQPNQRPAKP